MNVLLNEERTGHNQGHLKPRSMTLKGMMLLHGLGNDNGEVI